METLDNFSSALSVGNESKMYLQETAKWGKFLAIVGFVMIGLMAIAGLMMGTIISSFSGVSQMPFPSFLISIIYLAIAALYFFPCYYLYQSSVKLKQAIALNDSSILTVALKNQKSMFRFTGIMMVVVLCIYAIFIIGAIIAAVVLKH